MALGSLLAIQYHWVYEFDINDLWRKSFAVVWFNCWINFVEFTRRARGLERRWVS